ncbi:MAG: radical SAM protein, partial [Erysipelotrichaceae bacterium]|nr:radical SAM protein [Erysipelotrichaceae bacterium]
MNEYLRNLDRIEIAVTMACTGKCKHCQNGDPVQTAEHIDEKAVDEAIRKVCAYYEIRTLMTFGGEPLLYPETVCRIHKTAKEMGIAKRQIITNGYFAKKQEKITKVVQEIADSGVNDLLLSVDAFHQETIPMEPVLFFA